MINVTAIMLRQRLNCDVLTIAIYHRKPLQQNTSVTILLVIVEMIVWEIYDAFPIY